MSKSEIAEDKEKLENALARFDDIIRLEDVVGTDVPLFINNTVLIQILLDIICRSREPVLHRQFYNQVWSILEHIEFVDPNLNVDALNSVRYKAVLAFEKMLRVVQLQIQETLLPLNKYLSDPVLKSFEESSSICTNKYWDEFTELEEIGRGGFGTVWKARHRIDGIIYAIKKIKFMYKSDSDYEKVIREVKSFATLNHLNVVGYNQAWFENVNEVSSSTEESSSSSSKETSDMSERISELSISDISSAPVNESESFNRSMFSENSDDFIVFKDSLSKGSFSHVPRTTAEQNIFNSSSKLSYSNVSSNSETSSFDISRTKKQALNLLRRLSSVSSTSETSSCCDISRTTKQTFFHSSNKSSFSNADNTSETSSSDSDSSSKKTYKSKSSKQSTSSFLNLQDIKVLLYIQMEYCDVVLRDWLDARAEGKPLPFQMTVPEIFRDILNGVAHIHSKSIIHRDLKPQNIFYSVSNNTMKIGDFGLATLCGSSLDKTEELSSYYSTGVGTLPYAAPEQRRKRKYNSKVDMYSLGIILIELLVDIKTQMELQDAIRNILHNRIPEQLATYWPEYVNLVKNLVQEDPELRLSAKDALCQPPMYTSVEVEQRIQIKELKESLEKVKELLAKKELELIEKDQQIKEYEAKLAQYSSLEKKCN